MPAVRWTKFNEILLHLFDLLIASYDCCHHDTLAKSVDDAWDTYLNEGAFENVHGWLKLVLQSIVKDEGGNRLVEEHRGKLFSDATIEAANSGILVPIATIEILITLSEISNLLATDTADLISVSDPNHNNVPLKRI